MKEKLIKPIIIIAITSVVSGLTWGVWEVGRRINYSFSYENMVLESIKTTVKTECLVK